jgi:hypothetical protein
MFVKCGCIRTRKGAQGRTAYILDGVKWLESPPCSRKPKPRTAYQVSKEQQFLKVIRRSFAEVSSNV